MIPTTATDPELSHAIRTALDRSADVDSFDIRVQVNAGHVELTGSVGSYAERLSVRNIATSLVPASHITDAVHVRATLDTLHATDDELLEAGRAALSAGSLAVALRVEQRVATLIGHVPTQGERARARHAVESVPGVNFVDNQLTVG
jgi:osmotically-inducible protein OsmY